MADSPIKTELLVHDLKVPVSEIDAGAKSLLNRQDVYGPLTPKQTKVIKRIIRNTLATQRLVNDILELGRSREGVMSCTLFNLARLVSSVLVEIFDLLDPAVADAIRETRNYDELTAAVRDKGVRLDFRESAWQADVCLDLPKLRQILRNLVSNAFKHRSAFVEVSGRIQDNCLVLVVKDDGRGIPKADHKKIFSTYFSKDSSRKGGLIDETIQSHGLGLAGVMVLLRDMGGELTLVSDEGQGARFIVIIPL